MLAAVSPRVEGLGRTASPSEVLGSCPTFGCTWGRGNECHVEKWHTAVHMMSKKMTCKHTFLCLVS